MITVFWVIWALYLLVAARWAWGAVEISRAGLAQLRLTPLPERTAQPGDPRLTVLVAAHNEADNIEDCLTRLRGQNYPLAQIVVINDRSSDATHDVVARLAATDPRISLLDVDALPEGWIGKTHALMRGAATATGDYLLFIDSDVFLRPGALAAVMDRAIRENADFVTLWPRLALRSLPDRLLVPATGWLLSFWAGVKGYAASNAASPVMGNGQFLMVRRNAYERIGGHAAVRAELAEDAILAQKVHAAGLKSWVGLGHGLYVTGRESTLSRCSNGMARVMIGTLVTPAKIIISTQIVLGGCVMPFWIFPLALVLFWRGFNAPLALAFAAAAVAHVGAMFMTLRRLFDLTLEERGGLWLFPFGCVAVVGLLTWCFVIMLGRGSIRWGATRYTVRGSRILAPVAESR
jgi:hypothetical protein